MEAPAAPEKHRHQVVLVVLACLATLACLWTDWMTRTPLGEWLHPALGRLLTPEGHFASPVHVLIRPGLPETSSQLKLLFALAAMAFVLTYYLRLAWKKPPAVLLTLLGVWLVCGGRPLLALLAFHLTLYVLFHQPRACSRVVGVWSLTAGSALGWIVLGQPPWVLPLLIGGVWISYAGPGRWLLQGRFGPTLQAVGAWSVALYVIGWSLVCFWSPVRTSILSLEFYLLAWSWMRVIWYHADLRDGRVPEGLPLMDYLATFFSPAYLAGIPAVNMIGKGYAYHSRSFLARDKDAVVLSGLPYLAWAFGLLSLGPAIVDGLRWGLRKLGHPALSGYQELVGMARYDLLTGPTAVWSTLALQLLSVYFLLAGLSHLKVGLWRILGYDLEPNFNWPFLSTNLLEFWRRFNLYLRDFYLEIFYYPVFLRLRIRPWLRTTIAIFAAAGAGNFLSHFVEDLLLSGVSPARVVADLRTVPYYLGFSLALTVTALYLQARGPMNPERHRIWRFGLAGLSILATLAAFAWLRLFRQAPMYEPFELALRVGLTAFGLR